MRPSGFQFKDPCLSYINFKENVNFNVDDKSHVEIEAKFDVRNKKIGDNEAIVSILIQLGKDASNVPFLLETEFSALFKWDLGLDKELVESLLKQNAPALLLSYARPVIAMVTNASHFPAYNIPFVNFTDEN